MSIVPGRSQRQLQQAGLFSESRSNSYENSRESHGASLHPDGLPWLWFRFETRIPPERNEYGFDGPRKERNKQRVANGRRCPASLQTGVRQEDEQRVLRGERN